MESGSSSSSADKKEEEKAGFIPPAIFARGVEGCESGEDIEEKELKMIQESIGKRHLQSLKEISYPKFIDNLDFNACNHRRASEVARLREAETGKFNTIKDQTVTCIVIHSIIYHLSIKMEAFDEIYFSSRSSLAMAGYKIRDESIKYSKEEVSLMFYTDKIFNWGSVILCSYLLSTKIIKQYTEAMVKYGEYTNNSNAILEKLKRKKSNDSEKVDQEKEESTDSKDTKKYNELKQEITKIKEFTNVRILPALVLLCKEIVNTFSSMIKLILFRKAYKKYLRGIQASFANEEQKDKALSFDDVAKNLMECYESRKLDDDEAGSEKNEKRKKMMRMEEIVNTIDLVCVYASEFLCGFMPFISPKQKNWLKTLDDAKFVSAVGFEIPVVKEDSEIPGFCNFDQYVITYQTLVMYMTIVSDITYISYVIRNFHGKTLPAKLTELLTEVAKINSVTGGLNYELTSSSIVSISNAGSLILSKMEEDMTNDKEPLSENEKKRSIERYSKEYREKYTVMIAEKWLNAVKIIAAKPAGDGSSSVIKSE